MSLAVAAAALFFFLGGFTLGWLTYRRAGFEEGFRYGRTDGFRQAWLRQARYRRVGNLHSLISDRYDF